MFTLFATGSRGVSSPMVLGLHCCASRPGTRASSVSNANLQRRADSVLGAGFRQAMRRMKRKLPFRLCAAQCSSPASKKALMRVRFLGMSAIRM